MSPIYVVCAGHFGLAVGDKGIKKNKDKKEKKSIDHWKMGPGNTTVVLEKKTKQW